MRRGPELGIANTASQVLEDDQENEITITVFRMLVLDLLALFHVINQAMINILGMPSHCFF